MTRIVRETSTAMKETNSTLNNQNNMNNELKVTILDDVSNFSQIFLTPDLSPWFLYIWDVANKLFKLYKVFHGFNHEVTNV